MLPTTTNFTTRTLAAFMSAPVGYEVMFYGLYTKILPGHWAMWGAAFGGERTVQGHHTDAQMADMATEYREREGG